MFESAIIIWRSLCQFYTNFIVDCGIYILVKQGNWKGLEVENRSFWEILDLIWRPVTFFVLGQLIFKSTYQFTMILNLMVGKCFNNIAIKSHNNCHRKLLLV